jgi:hypothetical protein
MSFQSLSQNLLLLLDCGFAAAFFFAELAAASGGVEAAAALAVAGAAVAPEVAVGAAAGGVLPPLFCVEPFVVGEVDDVCGVTVPVGDRFPSPADAVTAPERGALDGLVTSVTVGDPEEPTVTPGVDPPASELMMEPRRPCDVPLDAAEFTLPFVAAVEPGFDVPLPEF